MLTLHLKRKTESFDPDLSSGLSKDGQLPDAEFSGLLMDNGSNIWRRKEIPRVTETITEFDMMVTDFGNKYFFLLGRSEEYFWGRYFEKLFPELNKNDLY